MQVTYEGAHSLLIGDFINGRYDESGFSHTWKDFHLIPKSLPIIAPPTVQKNMIQIPGTNGSIDMTSDLLGYPLYENRTGSLEFYVDHTADGWNWDTAYDAILNFVHGFSKKIILTDSPSFYYEGQLAVNEWKSDKVCCSIVLDYDLMPFKQMLWSTVENWLWNPFDFIQGMLIDRDSFVGYMECDTSTEWVTLSNDITGTCPVVPTIELEIVDEVSREQTLSHGGPPTFEYETNHSERTTLNFFDANDIIETNYYTSYTYRLPTLTIGHPAPNYFFRYRFNNTLRDASGNPLTVIYRLVFRPGRL